MSGVKVAGGSRSVLVCVWCVCVCVWGVIDLFSLIGRRGRDRGEAAAEKKFW